MNENNSSPQNNTFLQQLKQYSFTQNHKSTLHQTKLTKPTKKDKKGYKSNAKLHIFKKKNTQLNHSNQQSSQLSASNTQPTSHQLHIQNMAQKLNQIKLLEHNTLKKQKEKKHIDIQYINLNQILQDKNNYHQFLQNVNIKINQIDSELSRLTLQKTHYQEILQMLHQHTQNTPNSIDSPLNETNFKNINEKKSNFGIWEYSKNEYIIPSLSKNTSHPICYNFEQEEEVMESNSAPLPKIEHQILEGSQQPDKEEEKTPIPAHEENKDLILYTIAENSKENKSSSIITKTKSIGTISRHSNNTKTLVVNLDANFLEEEEKENQEIKRFSSQTKKSLKIQEEKGQDNTQEMNDDYFEFDDYLPPWDPSPSQQIFETPERKWNAFDELLAHSTPRSLSHLNISNTPTPKKPRKSRSVDAKQRTKKNKNNQAHMDLFLELTNKYEGMPNYKEWPLQKLKEEIEKYGMKAGNQKSMVKNLSDIWKYLNKREHPDYFKIIIEEEEAGNSILC